MKRLILMMALVAMSVSGCTHLAAVKETASCVRPINVETIEVEEILVETIEIENTI